MDCLLFDNGTRLVRIHFVSWPFRALSTNETTESLMIMPHSIASSFYRFLFKIILIFNYVDDYVILLSLTDFGIFHKIIVKRNRLILKLLLFSSDL